MTIPITSQKSKLSSEDAVFVALVPGGGSDIYLTPELIARAATFATTEVTLRDSNSELMNLCLAVGPSTSRTIKHYYLKNNKRYLQRTLEVFVSNGKKLLAREHRETTPKAALVASIKNRYCRKAGENHMAWMSINSDWGSKVNPELMDELKHATTAKDHATHPYLAFHNPAVAIQFGLMDVLKFHVEEKGIDINAKTWNAFGFEFDRNKEKFYAKSLPLIFYAMGCGGSPMQVEMYKYLLGRDDVSLLIEETKNGVQRYDSIFCRALAIRKCLHPLVRHPRFDVNGPMAALGNHLMTPLMFATVLFCGKLRSIRSAEDMSIDAEWETVREALKILLDAGADPTLVCPLTTKSSLNYIKEHRDLDLARRQKKEEYKKHWNEAISLMEKTPLGVPQRLPTSESAGSLSRLSETSEEQPTGSATPNQSQTAGPSLATIQFQFIALQHEIHAPDHAPIHMGNNPTRIVNPSERNQRTTNDQAHEQLDPTRFRYSTPPRSHERVASDAPPPTRQKIRRRRRKDSSDSLSNE